MAKAVPEPIIPINSIIAEIAVEPKMQPLFNALNSDTLLNTLKMLLINNVEYSDSFNKSNFTPENMDLIAKKVISPDIRAGLAMLIAGLIAEGQTEIDNIEQIDRGYENIDQRLTDAILSLWATGDADTQKYLRHIFKQEKLLAEPVFQTTFPWEKSEMARKRK